jgi:hypothetical protein
MYLLCDWCLDVCISLYVRNKYGRYRYSHMRECICSWCTYVYAYVYVYVYEDTHICANTCTHIYSYACTHENLHVYVCMGVLFLLFVYACLWACMYVETCTPALAHRCCKCAWLHACTQLRLRPNSKYKIRFPPGSGPESAQNTRFP